MKIKRADGSEITDWREWSPPKHAHHWETGRSAMELARAWFTSPIPVCPPEIAALLESRPETAGMVITEGLPEHITSLPERGEGRNHDMLVIGGCGAKRCVIAIEAKADEEFGTELIGDYWRSKKDGPEPSRLPARLEVLLRMAAGSDARPDALPWSVLRYQLLTALVGSAIECRSRGAQLAVLIVHEFHTARTKADKLERNVIDFARFVAAFADVDENTVRYDVLYGPVAVADRVGDNRVPVLLGKARYAWTPAAKS